MIYATCQEQCEQFLEKQLLQPDFDPEIPDSDPSDPDL
jgi:hypothetical protein